MFKPAVVQPDNSSSPHSKTGIVDGVVIFMVSTPSGRWSLIELTLAIEINI
jgi:hypothetical protein